MKKITLFLLVGTLMLTYSASVMAQPPDPPLFQVPPIFDYTCPGGQTPELAVEKFFNNAKGPYANAAKIVAGGDPDAPALTRLEKMIPVSFGQFNISPMDIKITVNPQNSNLATANYHLVLHNGLGFTIIQDDSAQLEKHVTPKCTYWMIIPKAPAADDPPLYSYNPHAQESGFTMRLATIIAYPQKALTTYDLAQSESNVKLIILGLMMYEQDYDNQINLNPQNYKEGLMPYLQSDTLFTAPGDAPGSVSYDINPNIAGLYDKAIKTPWTLVSIYQGHEQKLDFKYGGMSVVGFMDGHVKAVTPEEAKQLRWEP